MNLFYRNGKEVKDVSNLFKTPKSGSKKYIYDYKAKNLDKRYDDGIIQVTVEECHFATLMVTNELIINAICNYSDSERYSIYELPIWQLFDTKKEAL